MKRNGREISGRVNQKYKYLDSERIQSLRTLKVIQYGRSTVPVGDGWECWSNENNNSVPLLLRLITLPIV